MELTKVVTDGYSGHQIPDFNVQLQSQEGSSRMERGFQEGLLLFKNTRGTVSELERKKRCEEAGFPLEDDEYQRICTKIILAAVVLSRQNKALSNLGE